MRREALREIVENNDTFGGRIFDMVSQTLVVLSLLTFTFDTWKELSSEAKAVLRWSEAIIVGLFTIEYSLRIIVARKKSKFIFSFFGIVDLVAILPFYIGLGIDLRSIRILRIVRILRVFKLARYSQALEHIRDALVLVKTELTVFALATVLMLYVSSVGIYYCENAAQPNQFASILHALWWSVVTLTTVGYGDMYPITPIGKIFTTIVSLIGIGIVAVPTSLITSAMMAVMKEKKGMLVRKAELEREND